MRASLKRWLKIAGAGLLLAAMIAATGPNDVLDALLQAEPDWVLLGLLCAIGANFVSAVRWRALCTWLGLPVPAWWALTTYFQGVTVNAVLPGAVIGGDILRAYGLQRRGHPKIESSLSVLLDRLSGLWMLVVLGAIGMSWGARSAGDQTRQSFEHWWPALQGWPLADAALAFAVAAVVLPLAALALALSPAVSFDHPRLRRLAGAMRAHGVWLPYAKQIGLSLVVQLLSVAALACAARSLGIDLPAWALAAAAVPIFVMATLPVSFGGWGTREAAAVLALGAFGAKPSLALTASMIYGAYALVQALGGLTGAWRRLQ